MWWYLLWVVIGIVYLYGLWILTGVYDRADEAERKSKLFTTIFVVMMLIWPVVVAPGIYYYKIHRGK